MRILLVEDERKLALSLKKILSAESYAVDVCFDGQEGYEAASVEDYDLIILDIGLPSLDGVAISQRLRSEKIKTPIIMLTARDSTDNKIEGLDSGADDYIVKPFVFKELLARIRALLRRDENARELILEVDSLTLDPSSHIVKRSGKEINLSGKEYALLEFLMRKKNQIASKTQIIEHVWDIDTDPFSNIVDVYMGYLRKKIDKPFIKEKPLIHTVKGIGYRIGK